ncbi:hypothetical protein HY988_02905 [Candidatus Micrarchaeota archaeon]|nr:hypothetical protein [Candidatus Micrarchaeota archaeon]
MASTKSLSSALLCPKCGRSEEVVEFLDAFCVDCYPYKIETPLKIDFEQCKRCERIFLQGKWMPYNESKIKKYILTKCDGEYSHAEYNFEKKAMNFTITKGREAKLIERPIPLDLRPTICPECSRMSGGYYEGIIQLRGNARKIEKLSELLIEKLSKRTFIAKSEEKEEGLDIYVGKSRAVVEVMVMLKEKTFITKKLIGRSQGKRLYRTTFLLRL